MAKTITVDRGRRRKSKYSPGAVLGKALRSRLFHMTLAGLIGALVGWLVTEAVFSGISQAATSRSPIVGAALCSVEDLISRAIGKAVKAGMIGLILGAVGGAFAGGFGQFLYGLGQAEPAGVVLVLDTSYSMMGKEPDLGKPIEALKKSSKEFVSSADTGSVSIGLATFSDEAKAVSELTTDKEALHAGIDGLKPNGATNMVGGLREGVRLLGEGPGDKSILFFTDGMPSTSQESMRAAIESHELTTEKWNELISAYLDLPSADRKYKIEKAGGRAASGKTISPEQKKLVEDVLDGAVKKAGDLAVEEAEAARKKGIQIFAIGTGGAQKKFLAGITGDESRVFFGKADEIARGFEQAQRVLFRKSAQEELSLGRVLIRGLCWAVAGVLLALGEGLTARSVQKCRNAALGGLAGGLIGGLLFDPIGSLLTGWVSRMVAVGVIGAATGAMMGIVEQVLKEAWLVVEEGLLEGKEFVIYKSPTLLGAGSGCHICLPRDPAVSPQHAAIGKAGKSYEIKDLQSGAGTTVNERPVKTQRLKHRDRIQIGDTILLFCRPHRLGPSRKKK